jgi:hypothetical protein
MLPLCIPQRTNLRFSIKVMFDINMSVHAKTPSGAIHVPEIFSLRLLSDGT